MIHGTFYNNNAYTPIDEVQTIKGNTENCFIHDILFSNFKSRIIELNGNQKVLIYKTIFDSNPINQYDSRHGQLIYKNEGSLVQHYVFSLNTTIESNDYLAVHSNAELSGSSLNYVQDSTFSGSIGSGPSIRCKWGHNVIPICIILDMLLLHIKNLIQFPIRYFLILHLVMGA